MSSRKPVVVQRLPEQVKLGHVERLMREIAPLFKEDRPRVVFDFSQVCQIDSAGVDMLLRCVEEAAKRDGDLKLAAVPPESAVILELTRVDRIFEIFDTVEQAVDSFDELLHVQAREDTGGDYFPSVGTNGHAGGLSRFTS
jgi:anti-sigma B factor antagonist